VSLSTILSGKVPSRSQSFRSLVDHTISTEIKTGTKLLGCCKNDQLIVWELMLSQ
jgi:hypothetical protein